MDPSGQKQQVNVQVATECDDADVDIRGLESLAKDICSRFGICNADVSIGIVGDEEFRRLNRKYRNSDSVSDCLSFDLSDETETGAQKQFELILNIEQATREARKRGHSVRAELALYLTHGLLHNLGFDDMTDDQAEIMHTTEDKILEESGYGRVYNTNVEENARKNKGAQAK